MRYSAILVSALLLSSIYVITSSTPALAEEESAMVEAAEEVSAASGTNRFVVWSDNTCPAIKCKSDIFMRRSTNDGVPWKAVVNLSNNAGESVNSEVAVSGSNVYVVWQDTTPGNWDIFMRRSTDNGATWKAVVNLSNNAGISFNPKIAVIGFKTGSSVYVVWQDTTPGNYDIFMRRSTDSGATWNAVINLSNNAGLSGKPQIAASGFSVFGSKVYVTWQDSANGNEESLLRRSTDSGATWKAVVNLSNSAGVSEFPQIAASGSNVYVVWVDKTSNIDIFTRRSTDSGATWKAVVNLSNNSAGSSSLFPQIAVSGSNVYAVWRENIPAGDDIFLRRSTDSGATWKAVVNLSHNAGFSDNPQVVVFGSSVYVGWIDETPGNLDIFLIRSADNGSTLSAVKNMSSNPGSSFLGGIAG